jgi:elongation factor Ts
MAVPIEMIRQLREATGAGVMDCRAALEQAGENYAPALEYLRARGQATAMRRADHAATQGAIELYTHGEGRVGVMVEINTETDFVARSQAFRSFAHEIAPQIAASNPLYVREEDIPTEVIEEQRQNALTRARQEGKPEAVVARMIAGTLKKFMDERVLLRQAYIRDENITVQDLLSQTVASVGEKVVIRRFTRWELDSAV